MRFGVILSVDVPAVEEVPDHLVPRGDSWERTEGNEEYDYDYLGGAWETGAHGKWAALLDRDAFDRFVKDFNLSFECDTMGALGMPGMDPFWGVAPALSMADPYFTEGIISTYVTPWPEVEPQREVTPERASKVWSRVERAFKNVYR